MTERPSRTLVLTQRASSYNDTLEAIAAAVAACNDVISTVNAERQEYVVIEYSVATDVRKYMDRAREALRQAEVAVVVARHDTQKELTRG